MGTGDSLDWLSDSVIDPQRVSDFVDCLVAQRNQASAAFRSQPSSVLVDLPSLGEADSARVWSVGLPTSPVLGRVSADRRLRVAAISGRKALISLATALGMR